ncbi:hypothetical protein HY494_02105 [Candidatus Woesearchaeota archaeon]|nr:hypothetical protein [Candidatus Woesearchaeota archaeon]
MSKQPEEGGNIWEGLSKLGKSIDPFGVPFTAIFMANVLVILVIFFLSAQYNWLWLAVLIFALLEFILGLSVYIWKEKQIFSKEK